MERLTRKNKETDRAELAGVEDLRDWDVGLPFEVTSAIGAALDRLMQYEEIGLTPQEVRWFRKDVYGR